MCIQKFIIANNKKKTFVSKKHKLHPNFSLGTTEITTNELQLHE